MVSLGFTFSPNCQSESLNNETKLLCNSDKKVRINGVVPLPQQSNIGNKICLTRNKYLQLYLRYQLRNSISIKSI